MNSKLVELFKVFNCQTHSNSSIIQVCISSQCTQKNKLCCLECVDENHSGQDHILISATKFNTLLQEFHVVNQEKLLLNKKLQEKLEIQRIKLNQQLDNFFNYSLKNLSNQTQITAYEQINSLDQKNIPPKNIKQKINLIITNHSWIFQLNSLNKRQCSGNSVHQNNQKFLFVKEALQSKYQKLQKKLTQITGKTNEQIKQCLQKHSIEVKKLFHLFDEVKYKLQDKGNDIQGIKSHNKKEINKNNITQESPMDSLSKQQSQLLNKTKQTTYKQYINSLMD